jgi:hypothetical protein
MSEHAYVNTFKHSPIDPVAGEIRLLRIHPGTDDSCSPRCSISTASLDAAPPYLALSYTWGDDALPTHRISLNGKDYHVMRNLYDFLVSFRNDAANREETFIWFDQICIDQEDKAERSASIHLMRRIYPEAEYVIQWLGYEPDSVEAARELGKFSKQRLFRDTSVRFLQLRALLNN